MAKPRDLNVQGQLDRTQLATVTAVDVDRGTVSLFLLDQYGVRPKVQMPVLAMSGDSWMRYCPQVNDVVYIGFRGDDSVVILGYLPFNYDNRIDAYNNAETNAAGPKGPDMHRRLQPGEFDMRAKGGGYFRMDNIGDVQLLSTVGKMHFYGREGLIEFTANEVKHWDGKNWSRFGKPMRPFPLVGERELPASGAGNPLPGKSPYVERDVRLYEPDGNLLIHEALGNVMDDTGVLITSGASSTGTQANNPKITEAINDPEGTIANAAAATTPTAVGKAATDFFKAPLSTLGDLASNLGSQITELSDQVVNQAEGFVDGLEAKVASIKTGIASIEDPGDILELVEDVTSFIDGAGLTSVAGALDGLGPKGKQVRYRLLINKAGEQVFCFEIDEDGGVVISTESEDGIRLLANKGAVTFHSPKGHKFTSPALENAAITNVMRAVEKMKLISGDVLQMVAQKVSQSATEQIRTADETIVDASQDSHTIKVVTALGVSLAEIVVTPSGVDITTDAGTVNVTSAAMNINATGAINITGGTVAITGATVTIN